MSTASLDQKFITFSEEDLHVFSQASGDRNPLHLSREYSRQTAYGQPVVFGCLGAMACLGHIHLPAGWVVTSLEADFLRPMFVGVRYRVQTWEKEGKWGVRLFDGSTPVSTSLTISAEPSRTHAANPAANAPAAPAFERREAANRKPEEIVPGLPISGAYACDPSALATVAARWGVANPFVAGILCWSTYLVGMELPGESALFSRLVLHFAGPPPALGAMNYRASVATLNKKLGQIVIEMELLLGASVVASGKAWSYIRTAVPEIEQSDATAGVSDTMKGRVAVLLGSSRGFGAALKAALERRGAAVYGLSRSAKSSGETSRTEIGDAGDPQALRRLRERVLRENGQIDYLICNACPPILAFRMDPNAAARIADYINEAVNLTLAPLVEFLEPLDAAGGCAVIVSSSAVVKPTREWPHYVAAKNAVEALGSVSALQYPQVRTLIVRPPKLLTTLTNTPVGRLGALSPSEYAERVAHRLEESLEAGKTAIFS